VELVRPRSLTGGERRLKAPRACPYCGHLVSLATPHVQVARTGVRLFCSADCMEAALAGGPQVAHAGEPPPLVLTERKPRLTRGRLIAMFLGAASLLPCNHVGDMTARTAQSASMASLPGGARSPAAASPFSSPVIVEEPQDVGPKLPAEEALATEFLSEIGGDRWIHPLAGPARRMPIRISRVFGAHRHGDRPGECRSGHCGVDIGGEMWGEPIMAVHDGVVDRVKRVDEGSGGMYVRIAHRDGKVFSQYFHLAAIPRRLSEGDRIKAGQVIGLLGDTGVKESGAHLHFTISVKPTQTSREIYMDPEPLIALWPLKVPHASGGADASWDPGVPLGAAGRPRADGSKPSAPRKAERKRSKKRAAEPASDADSTSEVTVDGEDAGEASRSTSAEPSTASSTRAAGDSKTAKTASNPFIPASSAEAASTTP